MSLKDETRKGPNEVLYREMQRTEYSSLRYTSRPRVVSMTQLQHLPMGQDINPQRIKKKVWKETLYRVRLKKSKARLKLLPVESCAMQLKAPFFMTSCNWYSSCLTVYRTVAPSGSHGLSALRNVLQVDVQVPRENEWLTIDWKRNVTCILIGSNQGFHLNVLMMC